MALKALSTFAIVFFSYLLSWPLLLPAGPRTQRQAAVSVLVMFLMLPPKTRPVQGLPVEGVSTLPALQCEAGSLCF